MQLTPIGTTIIRDVVATDKDADNWYITYEIDQNQSYAVSSFKMNCITYYFPGNKEFFFYSIDISLKLGSTLVDYEIT